MAPIAYSESFFFPFFLWQKPKLLWIQSRQWKLKEYSESLPQDSINSRDDEQNENGWNFPFNVGECAEVCDPIHSWKWVVSTPSRPRSSQCECFTDRNTQLLLTSLMRGRETLKLTRN